MNARAFVSPCNGCAADAPIRSRVQQIRASWIIRGSIRGTILRHGGGFHPRATIADYFFQVGNVFSFCWNFKTLLVVGVLQVLQFFWRNICICFAEDYQSWENLDFRSILVKSWINNRNVNVREIGEIGREGESAIGIPVLIGIKKPGFKERFLESSFRLMKPYPVARCVENISCKRWMNHQRGIKLCMSTARVSPTRFP